MKKILKLLLVVPLLIHTGLFAIITAPSQLAPEKSIPTPQLNDTITLSNTTKSGAVRLKAKRTSTDPFVTAATSSLTISNNTIFTPLEVDSKNLGLPNTIILKGDATSNFYYIDTLICVNGQNDISAFLKALNATINGTDTVIYIQNIVDKTTGKSIAAQATIDKNQALWANDTTENRPKFSMNFNQTDSNISETQKPFAYQSELAQAFEVADLEKFFITQFNAKSEGKPLPSKEGILALNTLQRLKGVTDPNLSSADQDIITKAISDYLIATNNQSLPQNFLLQFNSTELEALSNVIDNYRNNNSTIDANALTALKNSIVTLQSEKHNVELNEALTNRLALDADISQGTALLDWFANLTIEDKSLIESDFYNGLSQEKILNIDSALLNDLERLVVKNYIDKLKISTTDQTQLALLDIKLQSLNNPQDPSLHTAYLQNKLQTFADPKQENALLDWLPTLSTVDQNAMIDNVNEILTANAIINDAVNIFNNASNSNALISTKKNIEEIFKLKQNFESLLQDPDQERNAIFDKAIVSFKTKEAGKYVTNTTNLSDETAQQLIDNKIYQCETTIKKMITEYLKNGNSAILLDPTSTDPYAKVFQQLPLEDQLTIINSAKNNNQNLDIKLNADLEAYQKAILPERIADAGTTAQLEALQEDAKAAGVTFGATTEKIFSDKFNIVEEAENRAQAANEPFVPEGNNTTFLDPTLENAQGQTVTVDPTTGKEIPLPANGTSTNPDDATAQAEIAQEDPELAKEQQDEEAKAAAAEKAREDAATAADTFNQDHATEGIQEI